MVKTRVRSLPPKNAKKPLVVEIFLGLEGVQGLHFSQLPVDFALLCLPGSQ